MQPGPARARRVLPGAGSPARSLSPRARSCGWTCLGRACGCCALRLRPTECRVRRPLASLAGACATVDRCPPCDRAPRACSSGARCGASETCCRRSVRKPLVLRCIESALFGAHRHCAVAGAPDRLTRVAEQRRVSHARLRMRRDHAPLGVLERPPPDRTVILDVPAESLALAAPTLFLACLIFSFEHVRKLVRSIRHDAEICAKALHDALIERHVLAFGRLHWEEGRLAPAVIDPDPVPRTHSQLSRVEVAFGESTGLIEQVLRPHHVQTRMDSPKRLKHGRRGLRQSRPIAHRPITANQMSWVPDAVCKNRAPAEVSLPSVLFSCARTATLDSLHTAPTIASMFESSRVDAATSSPLLSTSSARPTTRNRFPSGNRKCVPETRLSAISRPLPCAQSLEGERDAEQAGRRLAHVLHHFHGKHARRCERLRHGEERCDDVCLLTRKWFGHEYLFPKNPKVKVFDLFPFNATNPLTRFG